MTNNIISFDFNGVKVIIDSNTRFVRLEAVAAGTNVTYHDAADNSNYQVPTGLKFTIIFIESMTPNNTSRISSTTAADSSTGEVILFNTIADVINTIMISSEVAADLFITRTISATDSPSIIFGIEETA